MRYTPNNTRSWKDSEKKESLYKEMIRQGYRINKDGTISSGKEVEKERKK